MLAFTFAATLLPVSSFAEAKADKIKTEDILAKHLDSIGTAEARNAITSIFAAGSSKAVSKGRNAGETVGIVVMASTGKKNMVGMKFDNSDYPFEKFAFDGKDFRFGFLSAGQRSQLGGFMLSNQKAFRVGILGGALTTSWELLNYDPRVGKFKCGGTKKIDKVKHHKCSYNPKKGSELKMTLYFHPETFRHVRTDYRRVISGGQGRGIDNSTSQSEVRYLFSETFSDFKKVEQLTLPHSYVISYERTGRSGLDYEWRMQLSSFKFNGPIEDSNFEVDNY
jgi:hypothetical protein